MSARISNVAPSDLPAVRSLIAAAIRASVAHGEDADFLIADTNEGLDAWRLNPGSSLHLKCEEGDSLAGVVLVRDSWNLVNLFVDPGRQGRGIGRLLLGHVIEICRPKSPRGALLVNSSTVAVGFYERMGFVRAGSPRRRPGGCVPLRHDFR